MKTLASSSRPGADTLDPIEELIAEIELIQKGIIQELHDRRARLARDLADVDAELAEWTWEPATEEKQTAAVPTGATHRSVTLAELVAELQAAPEKTLNIRKAHLDAKSIRALAKAHPGLLRLGGKGSWPTVTLLEPAKEKNSQANDSQQEVFPDL